VRNRNAVPDTSWELPLPLHHGLEDIGRRDGRPIPPHQELDQLPQHALLTLGPDRDQYSVGSQEFGEPQWSMSKCRNRLKIVDLS